jgi:hypothetical protein
MDEKYVTFLSMDEKLITDVCSDEVFKEKKKKREEGLCIVSDEMRTNFEDPKIFEW